jgi:long-chain fatty acid transport protein
MGKIGKWSLTAMFFLLSISNSAWGAGLWLYEGGTPDMGTAAAGRAALANDASTAGTNPAGMIRLDRSQMQIGVQPLYLNSEFSPDSGTTVSGSDGGNAGGWILAGSFSYAHKLNENWRFGVSAGSYFGLGLDPKDDWVGRYHVTEAEFVTFGINPSVGYRINESFSIGAGFSIVYSELTQKAAVNNLLDRIPDGRLEIEDDDFGYGWNFGVLYQLSQVTRFGLSYRSEVDIDYKDTVKLEGLGPLLTAALVNSGLIGSEVDLEMNLPQAVMLSGYHQLNESLALVGNLGWQEWSVFGKSDVIVNSADTTKLTQDRNYKDTWHVALGLQYRIDEPWLLSLGIAYDTSPVDDEDRTLDLPLDRQIRYAAGIQYDWSEDITLGFAYEFADLGSADIEQKRGPFAGEVVGDYDSNHIHFFNFNAIWRF